MSTIITAASSSFPNTAPILSNYYRVPLSGLLALYEFSDGSGVTVSDISGNSNNATISNATWVTEGLQFDGTTSSVSTFIVAGLDYEWLVLVKPDTTGAQFQAIVGAGLSTDNGGEGYFFNNFGGTYSARHIGTNTSNAATVSTVTFAAGTQSNWRGISFSRSGLATASNQSVQNLATGISSSATVSGTYKDLGQTIKFGITSPSGTQIFKGRLAYAALYNRVLTSDERAKVYGDMVFVANAKGISTIS